MWSISAELTPLSPHYSSLSTATMSDCAAAKVMFSFFDDDGNGGITLVELKEALAGVGVKFSEEEITAFFNKVTCYRPCKGWGTYMTCNGWVVTYRQWVG